MKLLIVDDSALVRGFLKEIFTVQAKFDVVGEATNGEAGCEKNLELQPDVIVMDVNMPILNGINATKRIMQERPIPIIIFSSNTDANLGFEAISAGAFDVMRKPTIDQLNDPGFQSAFFGKIIAAANAGTRTARTRGAENRLLTMEMHKTGTTQRIADRPSETVAAVVIGASTGGPLAVREVLKGLPASFPVGIALVQHLEEGFDSGYARWLDDYTELSVRLAGPEPERFTPGTVIVAPVNWHLVVVDGRIALSDGPKVLNQKPSVDALFTSAADWFGARAIGILLTGMGRDGAEGCRRIHDNGGRTLVQNESTSAIFGMPKAAIEVGGATEVLPLEQIPKRLMALLATVDRGTP
jgi:two-component system chemotaxis response regulator CheB